MGFYALHSKPHKKNHLLRKLRKQFFCSAFFFKVESNLKNQFGTYIYFKRIFFVVVSMLLLNVLSLNLDT